MNYNRETKMAKKMAVHPEIRALVDYVAEVRETDYRTPTEHLIDKYFTDEVIWSSEKDEWREKMTRDQKAQFTQRIEEHVKYSMPVLMDVV